MGRLTVFVPRRTFLSVNPDKHSEGCLTSLCTVFPYLTICKLSIKQNTAELDSAQTDFFYFQEVLVDLKLTVQRVARYTL